MKRKKYTKEEIKGIVESNSDCRFRDTYMEKYKYGTRRVLHLTCDCGRDFEVLWVKFNRSDGRKQRQCQECGKAIRTAATIMTDEKYEQLKKSNGVNIVHLEPCRGGHNPIRHICPVCGNENWKPTPGNVLNKASTQCTDCHMKKFTASRKITNEEYQDLKKSKGLKVVNIEPYKGWSESILHICTQCKCEYSVPPGRVLTRLSEVCEPCSYSLRAEKAVSSNVKIHEVATNLGCQWVSGEYLGKDSILTFECECGNLFEKVFNDFRNGWNRCKSCAFSIPVGEDRIIKWLKANEIPFQHQYKFDDLRGKRNMPYSFDFGVLDTEGKLLHLIEYDGEHHFRPVYFSVDTHEVAVRRLEEVQSRDKEKDAYAKRNQIPLTRLSGTQYKYLDKYLKHLL